MTRRPTFAVIATLCAALAGLSVDRQLPAAEVFESVDYPGAIATTAYGISPTGDIVGDYVDSQNRRHGFLRSRGEFWPIDVPDAIATIAFGINAAGDIVGDYTDFPGTNFTRGPIGATSSATTTTRRAGATGSCTGGCGNRLA